MTKTIHSQVVLLLSDKSSESIIKLFNKLTDETVGCADSIFLYHQKDEFLPVSLESLNRFVFTNNILSELGYRPIEETLVPGSNHFPVLGYYLQNQNYEYYWVIEDDVRFSGNWNMLIEYFTDSEADFISSCLETYLKNPGWYWWDKLSTTNGTIPLGNRVKSFNPIYRISNRALALLHKSLSDGWSGHHEVVIPTLFHENGLRIVDFGGEGSFVPANSKNQFYIKETMSHLPIQLGNVSNRFYHPIKENNMRHQLLSDKTNFTIKKNCIISAVGKNSLHKEWIKEASAFDLHLIVYDDSMPKFSDDTSFIAQGKGFKFKLVHEYLIQNPVLIEQYDYFFVPDDDIIMTASHIDRLFGYMEEFSLSIAQPALSDSYYTYEHTMKRRGTILRYTDFVEVMIPCFSRQALKKTLFTFNENVSGWGIDYHWSELIGFTGIEMAVIDDLYCVHTRPVQSCSEHNVKELRDYLKKYNLSRDIKECGQILIAEEKRVVNGNWKSMMSKPEKQKGVEEKLEVILRVLLSVINEIGVVGLAEGRIGISLFFFNYYRLTGKRKYYDIALVVFESIYDSIRTITRDISLASGLSGVSWAVEYLAQDGFIEEDTDEILEEICTVMDERNPLNLSITDLKIKSEQELAGKASFTINEVMGYGMHYLSRMSNCNFQLELNAGRLTEKFITFQIVDYLDALKTNFNSCKLSPAFPSDEMSLAENSASLAAIIYYLSRLHGLNIGHSKVLSLLTGYIEIAKQGKCFADSNILIALLHANAFLHAARVTKNGDWKQYAIKLAQKTLLTEVVCCSDVTMASDKVKIGHLYNRIFQFTFRDEFRIAAENWIGHVLKLGNGDDIVQQLKTDRKFGLKDGLAGIGLVLIATIADFEPKWDEIISVIHPVR